ncbi:uncharacterized protein LOC143564382 [Bidens hawaiensis]|uniref:uncharacterized protein LOC143564382 n=1 Tax=Bidens hawaiensis TaxID=980011 RepID=UPI00404AED0C
MRIRKHAKTSAFLLHTSNNNNNNNNNQQSSLCPLNQSPWDIITFPSTHSSSTSIHLFDDYVTHYDVNVAANRSSADDSSRPIQSVASNKNSFDCDNDIADKNGNGSGNVDDDDNIMNYKSYQKEEEEKLGFMSEEDNCGVDKQNDVVWSTSKKAQSFVPKSRGNKKRAVAVTSKQNEFYYYYSGFGPSWGKKRGGNRCTSFNACSTTIGVGGVDDVDMDMDMDMDMVKGEKWGEPDTTAMRTVWSCQEGPGVDFFADVEEDEKHKEKAVKKRGRKPIKERSLKSLM